MNLRQELDRLANEAVFRTDVDQVLRRARRARARRLAAAPSAVILVVMAIMLPSWAPRAPHPTASPRPTGRTYMTLTAKDNLVSPDAAKTVLKARAKALGLSDPQVSIEPDGTIVVSVAGAASENLLRGVATQPRVYLRKVIDLVPDRPGGSVGTGTAASLAEMITKLGPAYAVAQTITDPRGLDSATLAQLAPFGELSGAEVELLPARIQFMVPTVNCGQLNARPHFQGGSGDEQITVCDRGGKFLLDIAKVTGDDIANAAVLVLTSLPPQYAVEAILHPESQTRWTALTREAFENNVDPKCEPTALGAQGHCVIAIMFNAVVVGAPEVLAVVTYPQVQLNDDLTSDQAEAMAILLSGDRSGLDFIVLDVTR